MKNKEQNISLMVNYSANEIDYVALDDIVTIIKTEHSKIRDNILYLRSDIPSQDQKKSIKQQLPIFLINGRFKKRCNTGLIDYSNFICLDYDYDLPREKLIRDKDWELLKSNSLVRLMFKSPNEGIKVIVAHNNTKPEYHSELYKNISEEFQTQRKPDPSCQDLARAHFLSYDPDLYYNDSSQSYVFTPKAPKPANQKTTFAPIGTTKVSKSFSPAEYIQYTTVDFKSSKEAILLAQKWANTKFALYKGCRNDRLFKFACLLSDWSVPYNEALCYLVPRYVEDDFLGKEIEHIVKCAYNKS